MKGPAERQTRPTPATLKGTVNPRFFLAPPFIFKRNNTLKKTCDISKTESRKLQVLAVPWTLRADGPQRPGEDAGWGEAAAPGATQSQPGGIPSKGVRKSARAACPLTPLPRPEAHALRHPFFPCSDDRENTKRTQK